MIPNSPSPVSMLPRAQTLTASDLLLLIQAHETQGNKTRSVTLQALAAYLGNLSFDEITFEDESGTTYTINGAGSELVRPAAGQGVPKLTIRQDAQGIKLSTSPQGSTHYVKLTDGLVELFRKVSGLESGVTLYGDGSIYIREQQRFGVFLVFKKSPYKIGYIEFGKQIKQYVKMPYNVGYAGNNDFKETNVISIRFSKSGMHMFPVHPNKYDDEVRKKKDNLKNK